MKYLDDEIKTCGFLIVFHNQKVENFLLWEKLKNLFAK